MSDVSVREIEEILMTEVANILSIDRATVTVDAPFQSLGMSSMAFVELLVVIENTFDLNLMETDLSRDDFQAIGSLASRISNMK
jgi:acyl carrier protein